VKNKMIFTDRTITVRKGESRIDEPIVVYRGDYELEVRFTILNSRFKFMSGTNMIESEKASYGQLAILTPYGGNIFSDVAKCNEGSVTFLLTAEMLNQIEEVGLYSFQIRLMDYNKKSRVSIPPIEFGIEVREPIASEDHDNSVNNAIVGYSIAKVVDPKEENVGDTFDEDGNYNKTKWETGDRISEGKLNKIEDAIDKVNQNEKNNTATLSKRIDNNFSVLDATKADKTELDVERSRIDNLTQLPSGSTSGDAELMDIRTDVFGVSNTNAGTAVRNQVQRVYFSESATVSQTLYGDGVLTFEYKTLGASTLSVTLSAPGVILSGSKCVVGVMDLAGNNINSLANFWIGYNDTITLKLDYPIQAVVVYFASSTIAQPGTVTLHITEQSFRESIDVLNEKMHYIHDVDVQVSKDFLITDAMTLMTPIYIPANTPIIVSIEDDNDVISFDRGKEKIIGGVITSSGTHLNNLFYFEDTNTAIYQCEYDIQKVNIWVTSAAINTAGTITVNIQGKSLPYQLPTIIDEINDFRSNTRERLNNLADTITRGESSVQDLFDDVNDEIERIDSTLGYPIVKVISEHSFSNTISKKGIYFHDILLGNYKTGVPIYIGYESDNGTSTSLIMGCNYENLGYTAGQVDIPLNTVVEFIPLDDFSTFVIWCGETSAGDFRVTVYTAPPISKTIKEEINEIKEEINDIKDKSDNKGFNIKGGSFSIIGDSWSTFKNWIPNNNSIWYPPEEGTGGNGTGNDVTSVQQTWWWQIADRTGISLYLNDSWSGSTICGTGYGGSNVLTTSAMVTRVKTHMGETKALGPKPNIIFILAGTNDSWANSPIGAVQYSNWTESDLMSTLPAFCCMLDYLQTWNPGCRIINIVNPGIKSEIKNGFVTACEHYGIENLVLSDISLTGGHPNSVGMKAIADQIVAIL
jgi:hypothetical protein